ncbi:DUF3846 domain-containing protein [Brevibacillus migulae]|uniref:DUF3846 domain-containing protein n=1 Tax=Brevibacillus migulae TaxID=1644114 RepID=UPI00106DDA4B|nr:DUF3846 domain-containing protein [Brevibacillus migulae]
MPKMLIAYPGEPLKIMETAMQKDQLQELVGGPLECLQLGNGLILYANQNSNEKDLPLNTHFSQGMIKGPFVITKMNNEGKYVGLDENDLLTLRSSVLRDKAELTHS